MTSLPHKALERSDAKIIVTVILSSPNFFPGHPTVMASASKSSSTRTDASHRAVLNVILLLQIIISIPRPT